MRTTAANPPIEMSKKTCVLWVRLFTVLLSAVFIFAGVAKWIAPASFEDSLVRMGLFPNAMIDPIVTTIPVLEIVLGLMCLISCTARQAIQALLVLTLLYTLLLSYEWLCGINVDCGCFGVHSGHFPPWALAARNLGLTLVELALLQQLNPRRFSLADPISGKQNSR